MPKWNPNGRAMLPLTDNWAEHIEDLKSFHRTNGYGMFAKFVAFTWRNEEFVPITAIDSIRLTDLKNYEVQRGKVVDNTVAFISDCRQTMFCFTVTEAPAKAPPFTQFSMNIRTEACE